MDTKLYFANADLECLYAKDLLADTKLRKAQNPEDGNGGLLIEGTGGPLFVEDEFEWIYKVFLVDAPEMLKRGESFEFDLRQSPDTYYVKYKNGVVTVDDSGGIVVSGPVSNFIKGLQKSRDEYEQLKALGFVLL